MTFALKNMVKTGVANAKKEEFNIQNKNLSTKGRDVL